MVGSQCSHAPCYYSGPHTIRRLETRPIPYAIRHRYNAQRRFHAARRESIQSRGRTNPSGRLNLPAVTKARFVRALGKLGFVLQHQKGSHQKWRHPDGRLVYVYMHPREELRPSTLRAILRDAQIPEEEFLKAL